jgi:hypothetical protein
MTVKERIKKFIVFKKMPVRRFEKLCGLSYGYINNMRVSIQPDKVANIATCFPELNTGWLMTGEGDMLKKPAIDTIIEVDLTAENEALRHELDLCRVESSKLKDKIIELQSQLLRLTDPEKEKKII